VHDARFAINARCRVLQLLRSLRPEARHRKLRCMRMVVARVVVARVIVTVVIVTVVIVTVVIVTVVASIMGRGDRLRCGC
jgi:hypothetical protein